MRNFLIALALSISTASYAASLQSGIYEGLQLAVSPAGGDVTGYYSETLQGKVSPVTALLRWREK